MIFGHTGLIEKSYPMPYGLFFNGRVLANEPKAKPIKKRDFSADCSKNKILQVAKKMMRCKEAKNSRARSHAGGKGQIVNLEFLKLHLSTASSEVEVIAGFRCDASRQPAHGHGPAHGVGFQGRHAAKLVVELQNPQDMRQHPEGHPWMSVFQATDGLARGHGAHGQILHAQGPQPAGGANVAPQALKIGGRLAGRSCVDVFLETCIICMSLCFLCNIYRPLECQSLGAPFFLVIGSGLLRL
jgi:hypothetical protein